MAAKNEIEACVATARQHVVDAEDAMRERRFHDCSFHASAAAENASNALLLILGARIPRAHRNAEALRFTAKRQKPELLRDENFLKLVEYVADLEVHIVKARYPIPLEGGSFRPPHEFYTKEMAKEMLEKGKSVLQAVTKFLLGSRTLRRPKRSCKKQTFSE